MQRKEKVYQEKQKGSFFSHSVISDLLLGKILNKTDDSTNHECLVTAWTAVSFGLLLSFWLWMGCERVNWHEIRSYFLMDGPAETLLMVPP